ncbi:MAG TPA: class I SAM-dependent methyltransferase [Cyclobacteriaceae bacterium]|nr:class I SAM-dependent methyltransferase [Cyclobacteriaceae bacterium]
MRQPYFHTDDVHNMDSPREVVPVITKLTGASSVVDVGCGTGTWLKAFEEAGIKDYMGVDGDYVSRNQLKIPVEKFSARDLTVSWQPERKFDLAVSLEVAEHLPESKASMFVKTLAGYADQIIFSAAIPGQGGQNHLNEQWPTYWQEKFLEHGFYFHDVIRPVIWDNPKVQWWYRQNIFLLNKVPTNEPIRHYVHPEAYLNSHKSHHSEREAILSGAHGPLRSLRIFVKSIFRK